MSVCFKLVRVFYVITTVNGRFQHLPSYDECVNKSVFGTNRHLFALKHVYKHYDLDVCVAIKSDAKTTRVVTGAETRCICFEHGVAIY